MIKDPYLSDAEKISYMQRWVLVMSYIYYHLDDNVVTDMEYDRRCRELAGKIQGPAIDTEYGDIFGDFDGTTGFDLLDRLDADRRERIEHIAHFVRALHNENKK